MSPAAGLLTFPTKRAAIDAFLFEGETHVVFDPRQPGVAVPASLGSQEHLVLKFSHRYGFPLEVSDWGIRATLTFGGVPAVVQIPWSAIYAARAPAGDVVAWECPPEPPVIGKRRGVLGVVN